MDAVVEIKAVYLRGTKAGLVKVYSHVLAEVNEDPMWPEGYGAAFGLMGMAVLSVEIDGFEDVPLAGRVLAATERYEASVSA